MKKYAKIIPLMLVCGAISACSVSDIIDDFDDDDDAETRRSFSEQAEEGLAFIESLNNADLTAVENMPTTGSAEYQGVAGFALGEVPQSEEDLEILSDLQMTADFEEGEISGEMTNFNSTDGEISGALLISDGRIEGNEFTATASGNLSGDGESANISADMDGAFLGSNAESVGGVLRGTADFEDGSDEDLFGMFSAE